MNADKQNLLAAKLAEAEKDDEEVKHPLQNTWTLWYLEYERRLTWQSMQNEITAFNNVEDFWALYEHIKPPSAIKIGCDYSLFKTGMRPMWEDDANKHGGRWTFRLNKCAKTDLDSMWLDVILSLIGESFDHSNDICGAVVNIRKPHNRISVWTTNAMNSEAIMEIGNKLREALHLNHNILQYYAHKDAMLQTNAPATYTV